MNERRFTVALDQHKLAANFAAVTAAVRKLGEVFGRAGVVFSTAWLKAMEDLYRTEFGRLPGSDRTARLRKKRRDAIHRWAMKRLSDEGSER